MVAPCGQTVGVYVTEQVPDAPPLSERVHEAEVGVKLPRSMLLKVTMPDGVTGEPKSLSVTVAVHVVGVLIDSEDGLQLSEVVVERVVAVMLASPELPVWSLSP